MHKLKGPDREHNFKNAEGLHASSEWGINTLDKTSFTNEAWFHFSEFNDGKNIIVWSLTISILYMTD